ncbi:MAG TPA: Fe-S-containing hydro-lyase [Methylomirabilota bacterium]|nr:Fe-S-containing hydro-lyase [Methylomirabilota bacterium]
MSYERIGDIVKLTTPLSDDDVVRLKAGDRVRLFGTLLTGRDAAHGRLCDLLDAGKPLPIDLRGQIIYYVGPTPPPPGMVIGSAGPTTASRMDKYAPRLMALGLKGMIGKGYRSQPVRDAMKQYRCVYFGAVGGAGALLSRYIKAAEIVAYEDLGTEAIRRLTVEDFPVIVVDDTHGNDLYEAGVKQYARPAGATV